MRALVAFNLLCSSEARVHTVRESALSEKDCETTAAFIQDKVEEVRDDALEAGGAQEGWQKTAATITNVVTSRTRTIMSKLYQVAEPFMNRRYGEFISEEEYNRIMSRVICAIIAYCSLCTCVWYNVFAGKRRSNLEVSKGELSGEFRPTGICSWISMGNIHKFETFCCFCCMWAETAAKTGIAAFTQLIVAACVFILLDFGSAFIIGDSNFFWYGPLVCFPVLRFSVRQRMRRDLRQTGESEAADCASDFFVSCCCCVATAQEALFVEHYEMHYPLVQAV